MNYDDTCIPLPLTLWISLHNHCWILWCSVINRDSCFLNMALKEEWLTQHDLCDYGKSVRLYCLPGAIVTTNPQLIKPNSAFCLTVHSLFPSFQSQTKNSDSPCDTPRCCPQSYCRTHRDGPETLQWFCLSALVVFSSACWWRACCQMCNNTPSIHLYEIAIFPPSDDTQQGAQMIHWKGDFMLSASWDGNADGDCDIWVGGK